MLSPNLAKTLLVLAPDMLFSCGDWATLKAQKKCEQGEEFVRFCVKKACVGDGGELERALDDVFGI